MSERFPPPLTLGQLDRLSVADLAQLRERVTSSWVNFHPEARTVILALLDNFSAPAGSLSDETRKAYAAWQAYYGLPESEEMPDERH